MHPRDLPQDQAVSAANKSLPSSHRLALFFSVPSSAAPFPLTAAFSSLWSLLPTLRVYTEKEITLLSTKAGVNANTIPDINQALVDDALVDKAKIGGSNYFWSFPEKKDRKMQIAHEETLKAIAEAQEQAVRAASELADAKRGREDEGGGAAQEAGQDRRAGEGDGGRPEGAGQAEGERSQGAGRPEEGAQAVPGRSEQVDGQHLRGPELPRQEEGHGSEGGQQVPPHQRRLRLSRRQDPQDRRQKVRGRTPGRAPEGVGGLLLVVGRLLLASLRLKRNDACTCQYWYACACSRWNLLLFYTGGSTYVAASCTRSSVMARSHFRIHCPICALAGDRT